MKEPGRIRPTVALAAAYVIALQALLLPLSAAAAGRAFPFPLCSAGASVAGSAAPEGHSSGCPCAAGCGIPCCVHALAAPPQKQVTLVTSGVSVRMAMVVLVSAPCTTIRGPQVARAPPAA